MLEAAWLALSGRYPMAYDEDFHLGIIRLYAHHWSPFFASQPAGADAFGAVARDPSYLYHWLMSFPYRIVDAWSGHSEYWDVMTLRAFSIVFAVVGLVLAHRVLLRAKASAATAHTALFFFVLTPLTPFVAAQMNYDNLLFPAAMLVLLLAIDVFAKLRHGTVDSIRLLALAGLVLLTSLVKYSFLPVLLAVAVFLVGLLWLQRKRHPFSKLWHSAKRQFIQASRWARVAAVGLFVVGLGLFVAMYGYNTVKYHTPVPQCDQVLGIESCKAYGAWNRNYMYQLANTGVSANPFTFSVHWANTYLTSSFFAVNGIYSGFIIGQPLPVLHIATFIALGVFGVLLLMYGRRLFASPAYRLFAFVIVLYVATLWTQNYTQYVAFGQHVAEQGRYLWFLLPLIYVLFVQLLRFAFERRRVWVVPLVVLTLIVFTQGGGPLTYIARSDSSWWWEGQPVLMHTNNTAQNVVRSWLIGS